MTKTPTSLRLLIGNAPRHGDGVHRWLYGAAHALKGVTNSACAMGILSRAVRGCGRTVSAREIEAAVSDAFSESTRRVRRWPRKNLPKIREICRNGPNLADLWYSSPTFYTRRHRCTDDILDALFEGDPLLCLASGESRFATHPREAWRGQVENEQLSHIVPSAMSAKFGTTKNGKRSQRCADNVGPRHYLVCEFDKSSTDSHAARLWFLNRWLPLVLAVHSGGKSLHGWFACEGIAEESLYRFFRKAVALGADTATWSPCQLVRLPDGLRSSGRRQQVLYFDPLAVL